ncbi:hypothetical protein KORDIASMS9_00871 [Kordia sp. SMS9]|uniref:T9SS type A sorting domain-containing protein n=1 Tax=Kordia sp. SMS9 TaxID=2282170 RepID=UPI000E0D2C93|nr:T9SS type A sorting domain-containing protein [Kordia sp. SMS9]AXG68655.1 hypothetical protein KORDIASMS9_00871 [Kordia sp. SMS9]
MNLKKITLTTLFLFCIFNISAQNVQSAGYNNVDMLLTVADSLQYQKFELTTGTDTYYAKPFKNLFINIDLDYQPTENVTSYFRLEFKFTNPENVGNVGTTSLGITAPVLIPPVSKKKAERKGPSNSYTYPFTAEVEYPILPITYDVNVKLLKYATQRDYIDKTPNFKVKDSISFSLIAEEFTPNPNEFVVVTTYPNPITNQITIMYAESGTQNPTAAQEPLEVAIFDNTGNPVSQHTLMSTSFNDTSISYTMDTSQLQPGTYYFQLTRAGETTIKTIIKQ